MREQRSERGNAQIVRQSDQGARWPLLRQLPGFSYLLSKVT